MAIFLMLSVASNEVERHMKRLLICFAFLVFSLPVLAQVPGTIRFPTNLDTSVSLFEVANRSTSTLNGGITAGATTLTLTSAATFPTTGAITIGSEILYYQGKAGNQLTGLIRGQCNTSAASASNGAAVRGNIIACHHSAVRDALIATQTKIGSGSSTPTLGAFLVGNGLGTSAWTQITGVASNTWNVGNNTPKASNTLSLFFSNDANKPGVRWNGTSLTIQFSNNGVDWFDIASGGSGLFGTGTAGALPKFTGTSSLANSILSESGNTVTSSGNLRAALTLAAGSCSVNGAANNIAHLCASFTDMTAATAGLNNNIQLNASGASSQNHFGLGTNLTSLGSQNYTGTHIAGQFTMAHVASGNLATGIALKGGATKSNVGNVTTLLAGIESEVAVGSGGSVTESRGYNAKATVSTGVTTTTHSAYYVEQPSVTGTLTNFMGFNYAGGAGTNQWMLFTSSMTARSQLGQVSIGNSGGTYITNHSSATTTWDPANTANGAMTSTTVTITGAAVGNPCICGFSIAVPAGALLVCNITSSNTATVTLMNHTGGALDLASGTLRASFFAY